MFVPRCGSGSLKILCFRDEIGYDPEVNIHAVVPSTDNSRHGIIVNGYWPEDTFKFAVWRNPVERSISCWRGFTQGMSPKVFPQLHHCTFDEWAEFLQRVVRPETREPHIKRQIDSYDPAELDAIIPLEKLEDFMRSAYGYDYIPQDGSSKNVNTDLPITDKGLETISELYAEDLTIPIKWAEKLY